MSVSRDFGNVLEVTSKTRRCNTNAEYFLKAGVERREILRRASVVALFYHP